MSSDGSEEEANIFFLAGQLNGFDWGNDHEVEFHQIESRFFSGDRKNNHEIESHFFQEIKIQSLDHCIFHEIKSQK